MRDGLLRRAEHLFFLICTSVFFCYSIFAKLTNATGNSSLVGGGLSVELTGGVTAVYQIPSNTKQEPLSGILLVAHGCSHSATDWWQKSSSCPLCIGLPVECAIVRKALENNMAVIALSSSNRKHKCWINRIDEVHAVTAIKFMYEQVKTPIGMRTPPLFLLGASSGGAFVGTFSHDARTFGLVVSAICVQIMFRRIHREKPVGHGINISIKDFSEGYILSNETMIPTLFVHMPQDVRTKRLIGNDIKVMNEHTPNSAIELLCLKKNMTSSYFFDHNAVLSLNDSDIFIKALNKAGYLSIKNTLINDPRRSAWREVSMIFIFIFRPCNFPFLNSLIFDYFPLLCILHPCHF